MKILITGANGTLGTPLFCELLRRGHDVYGCDLFHSREERQLRADIRDYRQIERALEFAKPNLVFHAAAEFGRRNGIEFFEQLWTSNVLGTQNVIELCIKNSCRLVFFSSSEAYGRLADEFATLKEDLLCEWKTPDFHNIYALSKYVGELQIREARQRGLQSVVMRLFNIYGPGEHYTPYRSVVCRFLWAKLHGKRVKITRNAYRQLLYVDDFVRTAANIADRFDDCEGHAINIAHPKSLSMEMLAMLCGVPGMMVDDPQNVSQKEADISKARTLLDHNPQVDIEEGVKRTEEWLRKQSPTAVEPLTSSIRATSTCSAPPSSISTS